MRVFLGNTLKRLIAIIIVASFSLITLASSIPQTYAQTASSTVNYLPQTNPDVPQNNLHTLTQGLVIEFLSTIACSLSGVNLLGPDRPCLGIDTKTGNLGMVKGSGGLMNIVGSLITPLYIAPIHTGDYVQYVGQSWVPAKKALATTTGTGFNGLNPLVNIWVAFRNIVYLLFVIAFVVLGVGIILRIKLDAKTQMTVQNVIPKAIIGILLVTFSFAIAGFLIDLMYVVTYIVVYVVSPLDPGAFSSGRLGLDPNYIFAHLNQPPMAFVDGLYRITGKILGQNINWPVGLLLIPIQASLGIAGIMANMLTDLVNNNGVLQSMPGVYVLEIVLGVSNLPCILQHVTIGLNGITWPAQTDFTACAFQNVIPLASLIIFIILYIILLFTLFKVWFELIKAYAFFLFDVLLGPFWIILGVFPNSSVSFSSWINSMISNLAVFPTVIFMFLIAKVIIDTVYQSNNTLFIPPLVGNLTVPTTGSILGIIPVPGSFIGAILGFAIILITPKSLTIVKDTLKVAKTGHGGAAIGEAFATAAVAQNLYQEFFRPASPTQHEGYGRRWVRRAGQRLGFLQGGGPGGGP